MDPADVELPTLDELVVRIEQLRPIVDPRLTRPPRWRGPLRGEFTRGQAAPGDRARVALAFDRVASDVAGQRPRSADDLASLHAEITHGEGFRTRAIRVGGPERNPERLPPATQVRELVEGALVRSLHGTEPGPVASARLHLELLRIHPFHDGNGRTARLAAAAIQHREVAEPIPFMKPLAHGEDLDLEQLRRAINRAIESFHNADASREQLDSFCQ